jgi:hypothetical protein
MIKYQDKTLIDNIFLNERVLPDEKIVKTNIEIIGNSFLINKDELNVLDKKLMYQCQLYKTEPFYLLFNEKALSDTTLKHALELRGVEQPGLSMSNSIQALFQPMFEYVSHFYYNVSLKKFDFAVKTGKKVDFKRMPKSDNSLYAYVMPAKLAIGGELEIKFILFIPVKLLRFLVFFLTNKDISKMKAPKEIVKLISDLEHHFIGAKAFFPYKGYEFFNELSETDFQKLITRMFSSSMLSYDMLFALSRVIENGTDKVINALSKRRKDEFIENTREKAGSYDKRWVQTALYHILCNLKILLERKKFESELLDKFQKILKHIEMNAVEKTIHRKPIKEWVREAKENKALHTTFSNCSLIDVARALADEGEEAVEEFQEGISKRSFQDLKEDIDYVKRNQPTNEEKLQAKKKFIETYAESRFNNLPYEQRHISHWVDFKDEYSVNYAFNYIGPVDFSLGMMELDQKGRRGIIKELQVPAKHFVEDLLSGKITLSIPYGRQTIIRASEKLATELYKLKLMNRISLEEPKFDRKEE